MPDLPNPWVTKPTLKGALVTLRPFSAEDVLAMVEVLSDPEVGRLTGSYHSTTELMAARNEGVTEELLAWYGSRATVDQRLDLAVVDRATGAVVGEVVINDVDEGNRSASFRTLMGPAGRGRGLGTEATQLIIDHTFQYCGVHRISLEVYTFNPRARRVYEKVGFVSEGMLRDALLFDGEWIDAEVMAILRPDWEAARRVRTAQTPAAR